MTEDQVNEEVLEYFFILGMATLYAQMMDGAAAIARGEGGGVMNVFLINSLLYFQGRYLDICRDAAGGRTLVIEEPTTEQILLECCRELTEVVLPALDDETVKVSVLMLDLVLRNAALRAAHEIAWMHEEMADLETFAAAVLAARPDAFGVREALDASIGAGANATSLHLDDVVERYRLASEAFSQGHGGGGHRGR